MSSLAEARRSLQAWPLLAFLREELRPWDGRAAATLRITLCCTVVVYLTMLFQIPLAAYAAYLVYMVSQREAASTLLTGVAVGIVATIALGFSLLLYAFDASEPALRIPLMAAVTFVGMYLSRVPKLGTAAFVGGFLVVLTQTMIDGIPHTEALVRTVLWLWVVVTLPVAITVLADLLFGRNPSALARSTTLGLLTDLEQELRLGKPVEEHAGRIAGLAELRQRAALLDHSLANKTQADQELIETLGELLVMAQSLPATTPGDVRLCLAQACEACRVAFEQGSPAEPGNYLPEPARLLGLTADVLPVVSALDQALRRLAAALLHRSATRPTAPAAPEAELPVAGALGNRDHALFALKTTIAAMTAYICYNAVDWPGIRTAVTTCFFVALITVGETVHKLTLRLTGAILGGLAGGLSVVYLLPRMTDIGQLCLLVAAFSAAGAWVSTSSPRLSYAGAQFAFAFFLTVLQDYAPTTGLSVPRDRVVGILLGNVLMSLVFSLAWPVSAAAQVRASLGRVAGALARLLRESTPRPGRRLEVLESLTRARELLSVSLFEQSVLSGSAEGEGGGPEALAGMERLAAASLVVAAQEAAPTGVRTVVADWLDQYAAGDTPAQGLAQPAGSGDASPAARSGLAAERLLLASLDGFERHAP